MIESLPSSGFSAFSIILLEIMIPSPKKISYSSDPLLSCIVSFYTLIFLYLPRIFLLSPVLILTLVLLLSLFRLGATQKLENTENNLKKPDRSAQVHEWVVCNPLIEKGLSPSRDFEEKFIGWDVRAPLEVIYETNEGEEETDHWLSALERTTSLSMYYPESDSDNSSETNFSETAKWDSPERIHFSWEEEEEDDDTGNLIEITLEEHYSKQDTHFHVDEENLIEIDISP